MSVFIRRILAVLLLLRTATTMAAPQTILVLDASGSMWAKTGAQTKMEAARAAVADMLTQWPAEAELGLLAYGHRRKGDCADIELLRAPAVLDAAAFQSAVDALVPKGMTPISASVRQAAVVLKHTEQAATVVLVSDGEETCNADPCALAAELEQSGVDFTAHVIGFDLPDGPARAQLQCLAEASGGRYLEARDAATLGTALTEIARQDGPQVKPAEAWIPGMVLEWDADSAIAGVARTDGRVLEFQTGQTATECQSICAADPACAGWHYEPGGSFFIDYPRCHLTGFGFAMRLREEGEGFVAGVKPGVRLIRDQP